MYNKKGYKEDNWFDLIATKIAETRLSELGYGFIPDITPYFKRVKKYIESKAFIVRRKNSVIDY